MENNKNKIKKKKEKQIRISKQVQLAWLDLNISVKLQFYDYTSTRNLKCIFSLHIPLAHTILPSIVSHILFIDRWKFVSCCEFLSFVFFFSSSYFSKLLLLCKFIFSEYSFFDITVMRTLQFVMLNLYILLRFCRSMTKFNSFVYSWQRQQFILALNGQPNVTLTVLQKKFGLR